METDRISGEEQQALGISQDGSGRLRFESGEEEGERMSPMTPDARTPMVVGDSICERSCFIWSMFGKVRPFCRYMLTLRGPLLFCLRSTNGRCKGAGGGGSGGGAGLMQLIGRGGALLYTKHT